MSQLRADTLGGVVAAAAREREAATALSGALQGVRAAMETLDPSRLETALAAARRKAEDLALAANSAASLTRLAARASGLGDDASLAAVGRSLGAVQGASVREEAESLARDLRLVAAETAAQSIAARHSAGLWAHLVGLRGDANGYGAGGRPRSAGATRIQRV